jgi:hypothetical protein
MVRCRRSIPRLGGPAPALDRGAAVRSEAFRAAVESRED